MTNPTVAVYIDQLATWSPPDQVLTSILDNAGGFNQFILAFWELTGPLDVAQAWSDGSTFPPDAIDQFHQNGIQVTVSAGGATVQPITQYPDQAAEFGAAAAKFAVQYGLDGVDFDLEDPMYGSDPETAIRWTVDATKAARDAFPDAILTHAPQAPYFSQAYGGAPYLAVNEVVGDLIDAYNVQFYNQDETSYDSYDTLFVEANGWATGSAVAQIIAAGVAAQKILLGKPVIFKDKSNTGYVPVSDLANWIGEAAQNGIEIGGAMGWQFHSDSDSAHWGTTLADALSGENGGTS
ncbi:MAG: glycosyl hydrolase family 18 protein [Rhodobacter sp.]|nr:glycosyl hydrolase family 18 protein [Rhodobacter sp.]